MWNAYSSVGNTTEVVSCLGIAWNDVATTEKSKASFEHFKIFNFSGGQTLPPCPV